MAKFILNICFNYIEKTKIKKGGLGMNHFMCIEVNLDANYSLHRIFQKVPFAHFILLLNDLTSKTHRAMLKPRSRWSVLRRK